MIKENLTITKEDSTLAKLSKFCAWVAIVFCFMLFAVVWIIFFIVLGGPTVLYKIVAAIHKHHENKQLRLIARREKENEY